MLFDTTFLIDYEREVKRLKPGSAHAFLAANPDALLYISMISVVEFAEGFTPAQEQDCWLCLRYYTVLNLDRDMAWKTGQLSRQLRTTGQPIGDNDLLIAATALYYQLPLVTNNAAHFQRILGLQVITY